MQQALHRSSLVPRRFVVECACYEGDKAVITVRASGSVGLCPSCGTVSRRIHSRYRRRVTDLPLSGRVVELLVIARRFRCNAVLCGRQIFTERFAEGILAPSARRTARLDAIVHHLGLALGGRPAAGFAKRLMLPVSNDTLLRVVRRRSRSSADSLKVIGIDDWAWRRNHRYASIICNLERRRVVTLLPDREPATAQAWLAAHPTISVIARDRGGGYGEAAAKKGPLVSVEGHRWAIEDSFETAKNELGLDHNETRSWHGCRTSVVRQAATTGCLSRACYGSCEPVRRGVICPKRLENGTASSDGSAGGAPTAAGCVCSKRSQTIRTLNTWLTPRSSAPTSTPAPKKGGAKSGHRTFARRPDDKNPYGCLRLGLPDPLLLNGRSSRRCASGPAACRGAPAEVVMGDAACDSDALRTAIAAKRAQAVIPNNLSRATKYPLNKPLYAERHLIECCSQN